MSNHIEEISRPLRGDLESACEICGRNIDPLINDNGKCGLKKKQYMQVKTPADCPDFIFME